MTSTFGCAARKRGDRSYAGIGALWVVDEIGPLTTWDSWHLPCCWDGACVETELNHGFFIACSGSE